MNMAALDPDAIYVVERLVAAGFSAYIVGGSVRDLLLGKSPKDFDISTSARPEQIKKIFGRQCLIIGRRFRLAHIRFGKKIFEVSTFRAGEMTETLITNDNVWGDEEQDVLRRDFTINGLFYNPHTQEIIDYVGGIEDIQKRLLRTIGDPEVRFRQDPVRMLRLLKFHARLDFTIDADTQAALIRCRQEIKKSSPARLLEEFLRMFESCAAARFIHAFLQHGFMTVLFPPLANAFRSVHGQRMLQFIEAADQVNRAATRYPIERSVLIAALIYPLLEALIQDQVTHGKSPPPIGDVLAASNELLRDLFVRSFPHFPRKILGDAAYALSTQYRLTPFKGRQHHPVRLMRTSEFPLGLRLLKIRSLIDPSLQETYLFWRERYRHFLQEHA